MPAEILYRKDGEKYCINQYDIRLKDEPAGDCGSTWPHELEDVTTYLRVWTDKGLCCKQKEWKWKIDISVHLSAR